MPDYIYFAGRQVPIHMPSGASVKSFADDPSMSFYSLSEKYAKIAAELHPQSKRVYGFRNDVRNFDRFPDFLSLQQANLDPIASGLSEFIAGLGGNENAPAGIYQIAVHYDAANRASQTYGILCSRGLSTHFCIDANGDLLQYLDCAHVAWATNNCSGHSIAVDMSNPVSVSKKNTGRTIERGPIQGKIVEMLGYTDKQFETMVALIKALISPVPGYPPDVGFNDWIPLRRFANNRFNPPSENGVDIIDHLVNNVEKFEGMIGHYHCNPMKVDPGPAYDWHRILRSLSGVKNSLPLDYKGKHDIGQFGNSVTKAFDHFFVESEKNAAGGWYPIGANQSWHSGVHIPTKGSQPVYNMIEGRIIAVRNVKHSELGDPSFVLIEHSRNHPSRMDGEQPAKIHWYTLYMHLKQWTEKASKCDIPWIKTLLGESFDNADAYFGLDSVDDNLHKMPPKFEENMPDLETEEGRHELQEKFFKGYILLTDIPVEVGEQIGYSGKFTNINQFSNEDDDGYDELPNMIHLETFSAERPTDLFVRNEADMETWTIIEGAAHEMSKATIKTLLNPIQKFVADRDGAVPSLLKTSEIADFYSSDESNETREKFRRYICLHISEWSPDMNWTDTAINTVGWQWESEKSFGKWYVQWIPFQWMSTELMDALGITLDDGRVYTYNPIYLLQQLNKSFSGGSHNATGASDKEIQDIKKQNEERLKTLKILRKRAANGEELTPEEQSALNDAMLALDDNMDNKDYEAAKEEQFDGYDLNATDFNKQEYGEWPVP